MRVRGFAHTLKRKVAVFLVVATRTSGARTATAGARQWQSAHFGYGWATVDRLSWRALQELNPQPSDP